jgi:hypothetical protein
MVFNIIVYYIGIYMIIITKIYYYLFIITLFTHRYIFDVKNGIIS